MDRCGEMKSVMDIIRGMGYEDVLSAVVIRRIHGAVKWMYELRYGTGAKPTQHMQLSGDEGTPVKVDVYHSVDHDLITRAVRLEMRIGY